MDVYDSDIDEEPNQEYPTEGYPSLKWSDDSLPTNRCGTQFILCSVPKNPMPTDLPASPALMLKIGAAKT